MKTRMAASLFAGFCIAANSYGQGTLRITFDGPPVQPRGTAALVTNYYESGVLFTPITPGDPHHAFVRNGGGISGYPDDGTTYLQAGLGSTLMFRFTNGSAFNLVSVDLAEYSTVVSNPATV